LELFLFGSKQSGGMLQRSTNHDWIIIYNI
jgi:hypothetical protein